MLSFTIEADDADQRLDKFLKKLLPQAPLSAIYKMNRTGKVKINEKKQKDNFRLQKNDVVTIFLSSELYEAYRRPKKIEQYVSQISQDDILFRDSDCLILDKPAGINVHPGDHKTKEISLIEQVNDFFPSSSSHTFRPSLVHRIDRDTSGAIIIALTKSALLGFLDALQKGKIQKMYHAIVVGVPEKKRDTIRKKLLRIEGARDEAKVQIDEKNGQEAVTHYRVLREFGRYSLIECEIETGRTHQIRVHLASLGTPIVGDKLYGIRTENAFAKKAYTINRQMLHAYSLSFTHPTTGKSLRIIAPYREDMQTFFSILSSETQK